MSIEETKTFSELRRLKLVGVRGGKVSNELSENTFTPHLHEDGTVDLDDGQVRCWGTDEEIADALAELPDDCDFEDVWEALGHLESNA